MGNPGPVVLHAQHHPSGETGGGDTDDALVVVVVVVVVVAGAAAIPQRVVDQVGRHLPDQVLVPCSGEVVRVDLHQQPYVPFRRPWPANPATVASRTARTATRSRCRQPCPRSRASNSSPSGQAGQPVGFPGRRGHRSKSSSRSGPAASEFELGPQHGQRGPQLVTGVGDECAFPLERRPEPGRARVEGRGKRGDLVPGRRHVERGAVVDRGGRGLPPHPLDRRNAAPESHGANPAATTTIGPEQETRLDVVPAWSTRAIDSVPTPPGAEALGRGKASTRTRYGAFVCPAVSPGAHGRVRQR